MSAFSDAQREELRGLLCQLGDRIRDAVIEARDQSTHAEMSAVAEVTPADVIYAIDKVSEEAILEWFRIHWPDTLPVEVILEGLEDHPGPVTFPEGIDVSKTQAVALIDPIDGTRGLMYDKRAAWALVGLAPRKADGGDLDLRSIEIAAMTEIPVSRQWRADQVSAVKGHGVVAEAVDVRAGNRAPVSLQPATNADCLHGFASVARFLPPAKGALGAFEEDLWKRLYPGEAAAVIFEDQYISTGGQFYEILCGHDRFIADLRPYAYQKLGYSTELMCHPYDVATALVLEEAGCLVEDPLNGSLRAPLDTTSPVAWVAYANVALAEAMRPVLRACIADHFG
ncbi:MAG: inositol monophosphatase [Opitutales bacterium]